MNAVRSHLTADLAEGVTLRQIRAFLLALPAVLFAGTIIELILLGHYDLKKPAQLTPYVLCVLGLVALAGVWRRPNLRMILGLRAIMAANALGSAVGIVLHVKGNFDFVLDTHPEAIGMRLLVGTVAGASPLFAPCMLAAAALMAIAATYVAGERNWGLPEHPERIFSPLAAPTGQNDGLLNPTPNFRSGRGETSQSIARMPRQAAEHEP